MFKASKKNVQRIPIINETNSSIKIAVEADFSAFLSPVVFLMSSTMLELIKTDEKIAENAQEPYTMNSIALFEIIPKHLW